ncbi:ATP-binding cassette domain-containing protein [Glutamicibacter sp. NPDC087344]|uniref:ATP-binding cassette domain-containing protein n=1 Tax=Glutamicibacter sp. NPDC087344 TaxID=3363994 RepID=UPI0037F546B1
MNTPQPLLEVSDLSIDYVNGRRKVRVVKDVNFTIQRGQTLGLVGESGSGKSTIGRALLGLVPAAEGSMMFDGTQLAGLGRKNRQQLSRRIQVIFQDPYSSLDITKTIGYTLAEPLRQHTKISKAELEERVKAMLERVGLPPEAAERYPAQFSGGQRQRIAIARALIGEPDFVVCDEPVSALDLSIQAEVMNLLAKLQRSMGLSLLFISHDLSVVRHISDELVVLRRGVIVEHGPAETVYANPQHEYTRALLDASPVPNPEEQALRRARRQALASAK